MSNKDKAVELSVDLEDGQNTLSTEEFLHSPTALTENDASMWLPRNDEDIDDGTEHSDIDISVSGFSSKEPSPDASNGTKKKILTEHDLNDNLSKKRSFVHLLVDEAADNSNPYENEPKLTSRRCCCAFIVLFIIALIGAAGALASMHDGSSGSSSGSSEKNILIRDTVASTAAPTALETLLFSTQTPSKTPTQSLLVDFDPTPTLAPTSTPTSVAAPTVTSVIDCEEASGPLIILCIGDSITAGSGSSCPEEEACIDERFGDSNGRGGAYSMPANLAIYLARTSSNDTSPITDAERAALYENSYVLYKNEARIDQTTPKDDHHVSVFSVDPSKAIVYNLGHSGRTLTASDSQYADYWKYDFIAGSGQFTQLVRADGLTYESLPDDWNTAFVMLGTNDATLDDVAQDKYNEAMTELLMVISNSTRSSQPEILLGTTPPRDAPGVASEAWDPWDYDIIMNDLPSWIREYAEAYAFDLVDFASILLDGFLNQDLDSPNIYLSDGLHPNNEGYDLMATEIAQKISFRQQANEPCSENRR